MKSLAACLLALAVASSAARADEHAHRLKVAGIALAAAGSALTLAGVGLVTWGVVRPPTQNVSHGWCGNGCSDGGFYDPPLVAGAVALGVGAAALGSGIALIIVGQRGEHRSLALTGDGLRVAF